MDNDSAGVGDDAAQETSNKLALAAAILAAGAFVVAFLQTILQYIGSSGARNKCTYSAIDVSAKEVKFGWSWRFWKVRVYYPLLDFSYKEILYLQRQSSEQAINHQSSLMEDIRLDHSWTWMTTQGKDRISRGSIADPFTKMVKSAPNEIVSTKDLTSIETVKFYWWKIRHPYYFVIPPRASWAQLLHAFGINDTSPITYRYADADLIPGAIDVPIQRIKLFDLGILTLLLGFDSINIDIRKRRFEAEGPLGTVTTIDQVDIGKVLRFEGDIFAIHKQVSQGFSYMLGYCVGLATGRLSFGPDYVMRSYYYPLWMLPRALTEGWRVDRFESEFSEALIGTMRSPDFCSGQIGAETTIFSRLLNKYPSPDDQTWDPQSTTVFDEPSRTRILSRASTGLSEERWASGKPKDISDSQLNLSIQLWQDKTHQNIPTVYAVASFATLGPAVIGFPSRVLLEPFMPWFRQRAAEFKSARSVPIAMSSNAASAFKMSTLKFANATDPMYVGSSGPYGQYGWMFPQVKDVYDACETRLQDEIISRDSQGHLTGRVNAALFPDTWALLDDFDPKSWATSIDDVLVYSPIKYRPINMLWAQVLILDVAIRFLVQDGWPQGPKEQFVLWSKETIDVVAAIVKSWCPQSSNTQASVRDNVCARTDDSLGSRGDQHSSASSAPCSQTRHRWDLATALKSQCDLLNDSSRENKDETIDQLAQLLELRALFTIAFLLLNPDSSDVLLAQNSEVEMPMV